MHSFKGAFFLLDVLLFVSFTTKAVCDNSRPPFAFSTATYSSSISIATPSTIDVQVGGGEGYIFSPSTITAPQGSVLNFHFYPGDHSVAESEFGSPCEYTDGGIWSGYVSADSGIATNMFSVTINDTNAHWLYCSQSRHCQAGMTMVINPPDNSSDTLQAYQSAAQGANSASTAGSTVTGGTFVANADSSSSSSTSTSTSSSTSSTSSASSTSSSSSTATAASATSTGLADVNEPNAWFLMTMGIGIFSLIAMV